MLNMEQNEDNADDDDDNTTTYAFKRFTFGLTTFPIFKL